VHGQPFDGGGGVIDEQAGHSAVAEDVVGSSSVSASIGAEPSRRIQSELSRDAGALKGRVGSVVVC
jgi:hypothetical protein